MNELLNKKIRLSMEGVCIKIDGDLLELEINGRTYKIDKRDCDFVELDNTLTTKNIGITLD